MKKAFKIIGVADIISIISFGLIYLFNKTALFFPILYEIECIDEGCNNLGNLPGYEITRYGIVHLSVIVALTLIEIVLFIMLMIKMKKQRRK